MRFARVTADAADETVAFDEAAGLRDATGRWCKTRR